MTVRLVPEIVTFVIDGLDAVLPQKPCHDFGTSVPGCTQFPQSWTSEIADLRAREQATASNVSWRSIGDRRLTYREYADGVWLMTLHHEIGGRLWPIGRFPWRYGGEVTVSASDVDERYEQLYDGLKETLEDAHDDNVADSCMAAEYLMTTGWVAEALLWLVRLVDVYDVDLPESMYLELYALAVVGLFDVPTEAPLGPEALIASAWAKSYPMTWGLVPHGGRRDFEVTCVPGCESLVAASRRWLANGLPDSVVFHSETGVTYTDDGLWGYQLEVSIAGEVAVFKAAPSLAFPPGPRCGDELRWENNDGPEGWAMTLTSTVHPSARLAAFVLELALAEVLGSGCDAIRLPNDFRPGTDDAEVLRREASRLDLQRLVVIED